MSSETILKLGDVSIPAGAGRGISQSLDLIDNGQIRRTINGDLRNLTRALSRKFSSNISVVDLDSPAFRGLWRGQILLVECITRFNQNVSPEASVVDLIRPFASGSVIGYDAGGQKVAIDAISGQEITFDSDVRFVSFRPVIEFMITGISTGSEEYDASVSWSIDLEEV